MCGEDDGGESVVEGGAGGGGGIGSEMGWGVEREWVFDKGLSVELGEKKIVKYSVQDRIYVLGSITQRASQWKTTSVSIHRPKYMVCLMVLPPYIRATTLHCTQHCENRSANATYYSRYPVSFSNGLWKYTLVVPSANNQIATRLTVAIVSLGMTTLVLDIIFSMVRMENQFHSQLLRQSATLEPAGQFPLALGREY